MTDEELIESLETMRNLLVSVATGGPKIDVVNAEYKRAWRLSNEGLAQRGLANPVSYTDLWEWYGRWSNGDLPSWASRRTFVAELLSPTIAQVHSLATGPVTQPLATGWASVDRQIGGAREALARAVHSEDFQTVGLLCRVSLISLAQEVFDPLRHPLVEPVPHVSPTDFKRMIGAFISAELAGNASEDARRHARSALDLAAALLHKQEADFRSAALALEATASVVNIIAIVSGRRDPSPDEAF